LKTHPEIIKSDIEDEKITQNFREECKKWHMEHDKYKNEVKEWENKKEGIKPVFTRGSLPKLIYNWPLHFNYKAIKRNSNQLEEVSIKKMDLFRKPNSFLVETSIGNFKVDEEDDYAKYNDNSIKYKIVNRPYN
jgi:hypothetical protein